MATIEQLRSDRGRAAGAVALLHVALGWALILGLGVDVRHAVEAPLRMISIALPPPPAPEPSVPTPVRRPEPEGAAAPPSLEARPAPVVAPRRQRPSPVRAAPEPKPLPTGSAPSAGASQTSGPGSGAGGQGSRAGAGRGGGGTGGGMASRARRISGALGYSDYPGRARPDRVESVGVRFRVDADGGVSGCSVTASSGNPRLDAVTCDLIERRFRYRPATDSNGNAVPSVVSTIFDWVPPALNRR